MLPQNEIKPTSIFDLDFPAQTKAACCRTSQAFESSDNALLCRISTQTLSSLVKLNPWSFLTNHTVLWNVYGECENYAVLKGHQGAIMELHFNTDGR